MIKSMTGYGRAEAALRRGKLTVEIRTLNAKGAEINLKSPLLPKELDLSLRKRAAEVLLRGTIDIYLTWEPAEGEAAKPIRTDLVKDYLSQALSVCPEAAMNPVAKAQLVASVLRLPDVVDAKSQDVVTPEDEPAVREAFEAALKALDTYRTVEGEAIGVDVRSRVGEILRLYDEVEVLEPERMETVRARLLKNLEDLSQKPDPARFEQELVFWLDKFDINEEKVRLRQHCRYFLETLEQDPCPGKKLGFIIQEMGREINTTGSKANHAEIQRKVVLMKDQLEKIREQSMNIL